MVVGDNTFEIDDLILATGFDAMTGAAKDIDIQNGTGESLSDHWAWGPQTYLGLMVAGFPNMYMITGPQSPGVKSQMILSIEHHVDLIGRLIQKLHDEEFNSVVPETLAQENWVSHNNEVANSTLYPLAASWYMGANIQGKSRIFMPYVGGVKQYRETCQNIIESGWCGFEFK